MDDLLPADDFDAMMAAGAAPADVREDGMTRAFTENCPKCRGTGRFVAWSGRVLGACHACKGKGKLTFKTSAEDRAAARTAASNRKAAAAVAFVEANRDVVKWLAENASRNEFAASLLAQMERKGSLTDNQIAAVRRNIERAVERKAAAAERATNAPAINAERIATAFNTAASNGLRRPRLTIGRFKFSLAPATGKNPGAIYVKADGEYVGKIVDGKFVASFKTPAATVAEILLVAADPAKAAEAHGLLTGNCSCCGLTLTNQKSVQLGIGPICRAKYGW